MRDTILVTGAAGFIGSNLSARLVELGFRVVGVDCMLGHYSKEIKLQNARRLDAMGVKVYELDLAQDPLNTLDAYQFSTVFHLAARPGLDASAKMDDYVRNNIYATLRVVDYLQANQDIGLFVFASTSSVYGAEATGDERSRVDPISPYGTTKAVSEHNVLLLFKESSTSVTSLRLYSIYGPYERPDKLIPRLFLSARTGREFSLYDGSLDHIRSFTYVSDVVDSFVSCLQYRDRVDGEIFNIGNPRTYTIREIIDQVEMVTGTRLHFKIVPPRAGDQIATLAKIEKAQRVLGFMPRVGLPEGLSETWGVFRTNWEHVKEELL